MKKINKIIVGTHNNGKFKEICDLLPKNIIKISPIDLNLPSPNEIGSTFKENSKIKAEYFAKKANLVTISDDSGLAIDLLSGSPGIYSSRWAGPTNNFNVAIEKVYNELNKIKFEWNKRKEIVARFISCLTLYWPNGTFISSTGTIEGRISEIKKGTNGFGYDPIFIPLGYKETFGELNPKEKLKINHRSKAFLKISNLFVDY
jgi:XTP/dITP diphosphohydrolase